MSTPNSELALLLVLIFAIAFVSGYIVSKYLTFYKVSQKRIEKEKREAKEAKLELELKEFYNNIRLGENELSEHLATLELILMDAINHLSVSEAEPVITTYNYYKGMVNAVKLGLTVKKDDLINLAKIHVEYTKIIKMHEKNKKITLTDFDKVSLN